MEKTIEQHPIAEPVEVFSPVATPDLIDQPEHDVLIGIAVLIGMAVGAFVALAGAWLLTVLLLSFEWLVPS